MRPIFMVHLVLKDVAMSSGRMQPSESGSQKMGT